MFDIVIINSILIVFPILLYLIYIVFNKIRLEIIFIMWILFNIILLKYF